MIEVKDYMFEIFSNFKLDKEVIIVDNTNSTKSPARLNTT